MHAASVGEVRAAQALIDQLLGEGRRLFITTNTPTGLETLHRRYGSAIQSGYPPVDVPKVVERFVSALAPAVAVFVELEIWPNRLAVLAERRIPVALVNARLSAASLERYQRLGVLIRQSLECLSLICAQTDEDARRFGELGVPESRLHITGSLKFDQEIDPVQVEAGQQLRVSLGRERPVWVAASIRQGEADLINKAHQALRNRLPDALLIAVPRHPERFVWPSGKVGDRHFIRASDLGDDPPGDPEADVLLGDTLGEMVKYLSAGDIAFVGGSLVPVGGHNPLEPAALGKPVLMGPSVANFERIDEQLGREGARIRVQDLETLTSSLERLFRDRHTVMAMSEGAIAVVRAHQGATRRTREILDRSLLPPPSRQSAAR